MKKVFLTLLVAIVASTCAFAEKGQSAVGLNLGYSVGMGDWKLNNFDIGVKYQYYVSDPFRLEAQFTYGLGLKKYGVKSDYLTYGINAHYLIGSETFKFYPIAGLGAGTVKFGGASSTGFMWNVGAGGELALGEKASLNLEIKYQSICKDGSINHLPITLGFNYKF